MRNIYNILLICIGLLSATTLSAQTAEEWIKHLNATLGASYTMGATVELGGDAAADQGQLNGLFMVADDSYYLSLGKMEVYSDGKLRYEVNNERKEVTIDRVDLTSHDILTNPTNAFRFASDEFDMSLLGVDDGKATISLVPRQDMGITDIELTLRRHADGGVVPAVVSYNYDGDIIRITLDMRPNDAKLPRWDKTAYRAYDVVSFI